MVEHITIKATINLEQKKTLSDCLLSTINYLTQATYLTITESIFLHYNLKTLN